MLFPIILAQGQTDGALFGTVGVLMFLGALLIIASLGLFLFAIADAADNRTLTGAQRIIWILISAIVVFVGPILYLTIGRKGTRPRPRTKPSEY